MSLQAVRGVGQIRPQAPRRQPHCHPANNPKCQRGADSRSSAKASAPLNPRQDVVGNHSKFSLEPHRWYRTESLHVGYRVPIKIGESRQRYLIWAEAVLRGERHVQRQGARRIGILAGHDHDGHDHDGHTHDDVDDLDEDDDFDDEDELDEEEEEA